jgi:uncharacterized protein YjdB
VRPVALAACAAVLLAAGCDAEPVVIRRGPSLTLNPASLSLVVGESAPVGVTFRDGATSGTRVRWVSGAPAIALVDSTPRVGRAAGDPLPVRGLAVGTTTLTVTAEHEGQTVTGTVPVTVRAAP